MDRRISGRTNRGGYMMLLTMIIVIVAGAYIYYLQMGRVEKQPVYDSTWKESPWKEEKLMVKKGEEIGKPTSAQAEITDELKYEFNVRSGDEDGGELSIYIEPDGRVWGAWHGTYYDNQKINYDIMQGGFAGNIAASKIYKDPNGEDASKLYLIAKGKYMISASDFQKGTVKNMGGVFYITGWMNSDHSIVHGKITATATADEHKTYTWEGRPTKER